MNDFQQRFIDAVKLRESADLRAHNAEQECERLRALLAEAIITMKHARTFISSREKMHPTGIDLYRELLAKMETETR